MNFKSSSLKECSPKIHKERNFIEPSQGTPKEAKNLFKSYEEYDSKRDSGEHFASKKLKLDQSTTDRMLKFDSQVNKNVRTVEIEEKKSNHSVALEENKWAHGIKLEEKKWDHGIKLDGEKEEREKERIFVMAKLNQLASQENIGKNYDLITQCVVSIKRTEEIG
ncbi:hypothetical protein VP01_295g2 [Puccinia sorghi]|uniref:Uncharacterized protein n=1 Tax=Puccinia sorghi TaxID=27349 RepID=A0A0L6V0X9_9BASI|nr:hypothetical protein VP01_295g2 [Puccinia sorghi]